MQLSSANDLQFVNTVDTMSYLNIQAQNATLWQ